MDKLALTWQVEKLKHGQRPIPRLSITINGDLLTDIVLNFEQQQQLSPYSDAFLKEQDVLEYSLANWQQSIEPGEVSIILLGCNCGQVECSNLIANVSNRDGWVYWQFTGWPRQEYAEMASYWFDLNEYKNAVQQAFVKYF